MLKRRIILALLACGCAAGVFALSGCNDAANQNAALQNQVQQMQDQLNELQGGSQSSGQAAADNSAASSASSAASASTDSASQAGAQTTTSATPQANTPSVTTPSTNNNATNAVTGQTTANNGGATATAAITAEQAKAAALKHAGLSASNVTFISVHLDYENGRQVYDVEFYANYNEYDYKIDASNGSIVEFDYDVENYNGAAAPTPSGLISSDEAKQKALSHAGISASNAVGMEVSLESEYGTTIYEVSFRSGYLEYDYKINAQNGQIIHYEREYD